MCTRDGKTGSVWLSVRAKFFTYILICHRETQFFDEPSLVWWKTFKFQLRTYHFISKYKQFKFPYLELFGHPSIQEIKSIWAISFQILSQMLYKFDYWASWWFKKMIVVQYKITGNGWFYHLKKLLRWIFFNRKSPSDRCF